MKQAAVIGLIGAILWLVNDIIGTISNMTEAISEGWFSYNIIYFILDIVGWLCIATLILFIATLKKRIKS